MSCSSEIHKRTLDVIRQSVFLDESTPTASSVEQRAVEASCLRLYELSHKSSALPNLRRSATIKFCRRGLEELGEGYACLDASRPWLIYWILHSLELCDAPIEDEVKERVVEFLARCQNPDGGFGGGPGQLSHLAPTYAAVNALAIIGTQRAFEVINRQTLASWLRSLRMDDGSLVMHQDGEVDIRGCYCALSVANLTNVYTPDLFKNTEQWLIRCQTYEGGFGGAPGMEAHGGYSFCGFASLVFLGKERLCNEDRLLRWATSRQMRLEGGFQGRTNKLVDGCYSFWQGGVFPILHKVLAQRVSGASVSKDKSCDQMPKPSVSEHRWLFNQEALQEYLLICCQESRGGLVDKPGKSRDFYHTCYCLSGLSVSQHGPNNGESANELILGASRDNKLVELHPLYNIGVTSAYNASEYFTKLEIPQPQ